MTSPSRTTTRIGVVLPEANITCETEFPSLAPAGYSFHYQRLRREGTELNAASLLSMQDNVDGATAALLAFKPAALLFACTSGTFLAGHDRHADMAERMHAQAGVPCVTTATAVLHALQAGGARRVGMLTPYPEAINRVEVEFLDFHGIHVALEDTFGCVDSAGIRALSWQQVLERARGYRAMASRFDALFLSCTNLPTLETIDTLEAELGVPVVSSNSASAWAALRLAGFAGDIPAIGALGGRAYR